MAYQVAAVTEDSNRVGVEIVAEIVAEVEMKGGASEAQTCNNTQAFERLVESSSMWVFAGFATNNAFACVTVVVVVAAGAE